MMMEGYTTGMVSPQFEGGIGEDGARAIDSFVKDGGGYVCFNRATASRFGALRPAVKNVVAGMKRQDSTGGSVLEVEATTSHRGDGRHAGTRAGDLRRRQPCVRDRRGVQGRGAGDESTGSPLLSGYLLGERFLNNRAQHRIGKGLSCCSGSGRSGGAVRNVSSRLQRCGIRFEEWLHLAPAGDRSAPVVTLGIEVTAWACARPPSPC